MPQKNIYIKTEDLKLFKKAEHLGESISSVISKALNNYLSIEEKKRKSFREYKIECDDLTYYFFARLLIEFKNGDNTVCKIYQTKGNNFVFIRENSNNSVSITVYRSFHELMSNFHDAERKKLIEALKERKIVFIE